MDTTDIGALFGRNAKRLRTRAGLTLDDVAQTARFFGLRWTVSRVGTIESGTTVPALSTMIVYAGIIANLTEQDVVLADLFAGDDHVQLTPGLAVHASTLRRILTGGTTALTHEDVPGAVSPEEVPTRVAEILSHSGDAIPADSHLPTGINRNALAMLVSSSTGLADQRAAERLGRDIWEVTGWSWELWKHPYGEERDRRAGPNATPHHKGRVSRVMLRELREAMEK